MSNKNKTAKEAFFAIASAIREELVLKKAELLSKAYDPKDLEDFSNKVNHLAATAPTHHQFYDSGKTFIHPVREAYVAQHSPGMTKEQFDHKLLEANRMGHTRLSRADMVEAMDPKMVQNSNIQLPGSNRSLGSSVTFINHGEISRAKAKQQAKAGIAAPNIQIPSAPTPPSQNTPAQQQTPQKSFLPKDKAEFIRANPEKNYNHLLPKHLQNDFSLAMRHGRGPLAGKFHADLQDKSGKTVGYFHEGLDSPKLSAKSNLPPEAKDALIHAFNTNKQGK